MDSTTQANAFAALAILAENLPARGAAASGHSIRRQMQRAGLSKLDVALALNFLVDGGLAIRVKVVDDDGRFYTGYQPTRRGEAWIRAHGDGQGAA